MKRSGFSNPRKPMNRGTKRLTSKKRFKGVRIDQADKLFSLFIRHRAGWKCERCGTQYEPPTAALHCSHFWGRARESPRFDEDNASAHCHGCHSFFTANPALHYQWKLQRMGQRDFDLLAIRAEMRQKKDRVSAALYWRERLKQEYPDALK